jgi:MFS family permease
MKETNSKDNISVDMCPSPSTNDESSFSNSNEHILKDEMESSLIVKEQLSMNIQKEETKIKTIDIILEKIGYTSYHYIMILACGLLFFSDGSQVYAFNLLMPIFEKIFSNSSTFWLISLPSALFLGYMIGTLFSGFCTHFFGRKLTLFVILVAFTMLSAASSVYENIIWLCIIRLLMGVCLGIQTPQYLNNLAEFLPSQSKEIVILSMLIFYRFGVLYYVGIFEIFSPDFIPLNWKSTILLCAVPILLTTILTLIFFRESPKMQMSKKKLEEAENNLNYLAELKKTTIELSDINKLKEEYIQNYHNNESAFNLASILTSKYRTIIFLCGIIFLTSSMISVSNMYSLPIMLTKREESQKVTHRDLAARVLIPQIVVIPGILLASISCKFLGRRYTILIGFICCLISSFVSSIIREGLIITSSMINFFIIISNCGVKLYVIEAFPTHLRDHALAICYFGAKLGDTLCPLLCNLSLKIYSYGAMLLINILCVLGLTSAICLPFDTLGSSIE